MGFKAINQCDEAIYSFNLTNNEWSNIKLNHNKTLKMPCCDAVAIPKNSKYGVCFFAHNANNCGSNESPEHQLIKYLCLKSFSVNGWNVDTEVKFNDGFIADVYATNKNKRLAIEVQLSPITEKELNKRHEKYRNAGLDCIWLCKNKPDGLSEDIPVFQIKRDHNNSIAVLSFNVVTNIEHYFVCHIYLDDFINAICNNGLMHVNNSDSIYIKQDGKLITCKDCKHENKIPENIFIQYIKDNESLTIDKFKYKFSKIKGKFGLPDIKIKNREFFYICHHCGGCIDDLFTSVESEYSECNIVSPNDKHSLPLSNKWLLIK